MRFSRNFAMLPLAGIIAGLTLASAPSHAAVSNPASPAYDHPYRHGVVPTREAHAQMRASIKATGRTTATTGIETLSFGGGVNGIGVTSGTPRVYLVVYGSQWGTAGTDSSGNMTLSNDPSKAVPYLQKLFKGLGTGGELWSGTMTQYCDGPLVATGATSCPAGAPHVGYPTGGAFAGIWYDNSAASPAAATGNALAKEAIKAAQHFGNTTAASNRYVQYVILSPTGTQPDGFNTPNSGFCAWHDYTGDSTLSGGAASSPYGDIAFTNMPYVSDAGTSCGTGSVTGAATDGFSIVEGHEYAETLSDQSPAGGWTNQTGNATYNGQENGDECAWITSGQGATQNVVMGTGTFPMQSTWSNDTNQCEIAHPIVTGGGTTTPNCDSTPVDNQAVTCATAGLSGYTGTAYTLQYSTYSGGGTCTKVAASGYDTSKCVAPSGGGSVLTSGVPVTGIAGATNSSAYYTIVVPSGRTSLTVKTSGGSGDEDLYVQLNKKPTTSSYLKRSWNYGNSESISVSNPTAGTYYIMLYGYAAYTGVTLIANY